MGRGLPFKMAGDAHRIPIRGQKSGFGTSCGVHSESLCGNF